MSLFSLQALGISQLSFIFPSFDVFTSTAPQVTGCRRPAPWRTFPHVQKVFPKTQAFGAAIFISGIGAKT